MKPIALFRIAARAIGSSFAVSVPSIAYSPCDGTSSRPRIDEQRRLAGARGPVDRDELALVDRELDARQRAGLDVVGVKHLADPLSSSNGCAAAAAGSGASVGGRGGHGLRHRDSWVECIRCAVRRWAGSGSRGAPGSRWRAARRRSTSATAAHSAGCGELLAVEQVLDGGAESSARSRARRRGRARARWRRASRPGAAPSRGPGRAERRARRAGRSRVCAARRSARSRRRSRPAASGEGEVRRTPREGTAEDAHPGDSSSQIRSSIATQLR